jgi:hypothetical protein
MGWKIYFWFITLLFGHLTGSLIADSLGILPLDEEGPILDEPWGWLDWLSLLIAWIGIVGLFGFSYKKAIGEQNFWKRWFIFILVFDISYAIYEHYPKGFVAEEVWLDILGYSIPVPIYIALYLYGYKSEELWNPPAESNSQASAIQ